MGLNASLTIQDSVGKNGRNLLADVRTIQTLINANLRSLMPLRPLAVTGRCDMGTIGAITTFQQRVLGINLPTGRIEPKSATLCALNDGTVTSATLPGGADDVSEPLKTALNVLNSECLNFATRFIKDSQVRVQYLKNSKSMSEALLDSYRKGEISAEDGAQEANALRNQILEVSRLKSSDIGKAKAEQLKAKGKTLGELEELYSQSKFKRAFAQLAEDEKNAVWVEIIEASGRARPSATVSALRYGKIGKGLLFISIAIAIADIATAEDKTEAVGREATSFAAGAAGAAATAAAVGWVAGPGYPVVVGVAAFVGGALAAWGGDATFEWFYHRDD